MISTSESAETVGVWMRGPAARRFVASRWPALYAHDPTASPYQAPQWLQAWAHQLPAAASPMVIAAADDRGEPAAALAMVQRPGADGRPLLAPLGTPWTEYVRPTGPASCSLPAAEALAEVLREHARGSDVVLPDVPLTSALGRILADRPDEWDVMVSPYAVARLPLRTPERLDHRRRRARWAALSGRVEYRRSRTTPELLAAVDDLTTLHYRRWAAPRPAPEADTPWRAILGRCGSDLATIAQLHLDGQPIAAQLLLHRGQRLYSVLTGWAPDRAALGPGHWLLRELSTELAPYRSGAIRNPCVSLDLGRTLASQIEYRADYGVTWGSTGTFTSRFGGDR